MTKEKRGDVERRFGKDTRSGGVRRDKPSDKWEYLEKRYDDDRRENQRRRLPERREEETR